jgi:thiol-disulfide isomerase/thioredoxin
MVTLKIVGLLFWDPVGDFLVMAMIIALSGILFIRRSELFITRLMLSLIAIGWLGFEETTFGNRSIEKDKNTFLIPSEGTLAPDLNIQPIHNPVSRPAVYDFSKNKWTMINFWASWCNPCIQEMPVIDSFYRQNKLNGIEIIGITQISPNAGGANKKQQTLEREWSILDLLNINYPIFLDSSGDGVIAYGAEVLPLSFIVDQKGKILKVGEGTKGTMALLDWLDEQIE